MNTEIGNFIPENIIVNREQNKLSIRYRWFSWKFVPPLLVIFILGFTVAPAYVRGAIETGGWIFPVILVPWVLFAIYYLLVKIVNYSQISADQQDIKVLHRPLPLERNATLPTKEIKNIMVFEKANQGRSLRTYYDVVAVLANKKINLLKNISHYDQAKFIVDELQRVMEQIEK